MQSKQSTVLYILVGEAMTDPHVVKHILSRTDTKGIMNMLGICCEQILSILVLSAPSHFELFLSPLYMFIHACK